MNWPTESDFRNLIRSELYGLGLCSQWVGDPSTSTFGIKIQLTLNDCPLGDPIVIDFVGKTD